ncbi:MAG: hypothetical protein ACR2LQ_10720 [Acidimicrobiales bacterium]
MSTSPEDVQIVVLDGRDVRRGWRAKVTRPIVGIALAALGTIFIIVGYLGVAHETLVAKQIPYLVSGGIGGMVLVAVGAFLLGTDDVRRQLERVEHLETMVNELHRTLLHLRGEAGPPLEAMDAVEATNGASREVTGSASSVVALARGKSYHLPSCTMVAGKHPEPVEPETVATRGLSPCPLCDPAPALVAG